MTYYDASLITKRLQNKAIADGYITRMRQQNQTGYGPLPGIYDDSIINNINLGQMKDVKKCEGTTSVELGCPCGPGVSVPIVPTCIDSGPSWIVPVDTSATSAANTEQYFTYYQCDSVYSVGRVNNTSYFYDSNSATPKVTLTAPVSGNIGYLSKYTKQGILEWIAPVQGTSDNPMFGLTSDDTGIYVSGYFQGTLQVYNGSLTPLSVPAYVTMTSGKAGAIPSLFLIKYDINGNVLWINKIDNNAGNFGDNYWNLASDGDYIYLVWQYIVDGGNTQCVFYNSNDLVTPVLTLTPPVGDNSTNLPILAKYTQSGNLVWGLHLTGIIGGPNDTKYGIGVAVNSTGIYMIVDLLGNSNSMTIYNANVISGNPAQPTTTGVILTKPTGPWGSVALIKYNKNGKLVWATNTLSPSGNGAYTRTITCDETNVYFGGNSSREVYAYNATPTGPDTSSPVYTLLNSNEFSFIMAFNTNTGNASWGNTIISLTNGYNAVNRLMSDGSYLYSTGRFTNGNIIVNSGSIYGDSAPKSNIITNLNNSDDIYIAKYSLDGTLQWVTKAQGASGDISYGIYSNRQFVYVTGFGFVQTNFYNSAGLNNPTSVGLSYSPHAGNNSKFAFTVKYSVNGKIVS